MERQRSFAQAEYVQKKMKTRRERFLTEMDAVVPRTKLVASRQIMARWMGLVADWLKPIHEIFRTGVMGGGYVQVDETPTQYLVPGHGQAKLGYLWTDLGPDCMG